MSEMSLNPPLCLTDKFPAGKNYHLTLRRLERKRVRVIRREKIENESETEEQKERGRGREKVIKKGTKKKKLTKSNNFHDMNMRKTFEVMIEEERVRKIEDCKGKLK